MKLNEGSTDRAIRAIAGLVLVIFGLLTVKGVFGIVLAVIGGVLVVTGAVGFCPLYTLFGINTANKKS